MMRFLFFSVKMDFSSGGLSPLAGGNEVSGVQCEGDFWDVVVVTASIALCNLS